MTVIGITGTLGAGKGSIVDYLVREKGFRHHSVRNYLRKVLEQKQIPVNRDSLTHIANEIRAAFGPSHIVETLYEEAMAEGKDCVIESIRNKGEVNALRSKPAFYLLAVNAHQEIRYRRIQKRMSETDQVDYQTFLMNEEREMNSDDPNKQNLGACIDMADIVIRNDGSMAELHRQTEKFLKNIEYQSSNT